MGDRKKIKVLLYYPEWGNRWIPYFEKELSRYDLTVLNAPKGGKVPVNDIEASARQSDVLISMWMDNMVGYWSHHFPNKKIISYCRRFEVWVPTMIQSINLKNVNAVVFVSEFYKDKFAAMYGSPNRSYLIRNGVDMTEFPLRVAPVQNGKVSMVCSIKDVKNMALAVEIMSMLPKDFTLHHIGIPFSDLIAGQILSYIEYRGLANRFKFEGHIERDEVPVWLADKEVILSTSINEGNPNNVIEAMAMGIKPVINMWPGVLEQFNSEWVFKTAQEAVDMIEDRFTYTPEAYRQHVEREYSVENFKRIHDVIAEVMSENKL